MGEVPSIFKYLSTHDEVLEYLRAHSTQGLSLSLDTKLKLRIENTVEQYHKGTKKEGCQQLASALAVS